MLVYFNLKMITIEPGAPPPYFTTLSRTFIVLLDLANYDPNNKAIIIDLLKVLLLLKHFNNFL